MSETPVDYKTDLCLRMMVYAAFDDEYSNLTGSAIIEKLEAFFPPVTVRRARSLWLAGVIPPRPDLSFYGRDER